LWVNGRASPNPDKPEKLEAESSKAGGDKPRPYESEGSAKLIFLE
jgi:hypothetical protein